MKEFRNLYGCVSTFPWFLGLLVPGRYVWWARCTAVPLSNATQIALQRLNTVVPYISELSHGLNSHLNYHSNNATRYRPGINKEMCTYLPTGLFRPRSIVRHGKHKITGRGPGTRALNMDKLGLSRGFALCWQGHTERCLTFLANVLYPYLPPMGNSS